MRKTFNKDLILKTAVELAKEVGFKKLTMRLLASRLKSSVMPIYDAYMSKDELIEDVFNEVVKENNQASSYFERNLQVLISGIRSPQLYRDIKAYSPNSTDLMSHYSDTIDLMAKEEGLKKFDDSVRQNIHFDLLIYISGLVDRQLFISDAQREPEDYWIDVYEGFKEVLLLGYEKAFEEGRL